MSSITAGLTIRTNTPGAEKVDQLAGKVKGVGHAAEAAHGGFSGWIHTLHDADEIISKIAEKTERMVEGPAKIAENFQLAQAKLKAIGNLSDSQAEAMATQIRTVAKQTGVLTDELSKGAETMLARGVSVQDTMAALAASAQLAHATGASMADVGEAGAAALKQFGTPAKDLPHVMDLMFTAATKGGISVGELGQSLAKAAPFAREAGLSLNSTITALTVLGKAGISGGMAGQGIASMIKGLVSNSKQGQQALASLGISHKQAMKAVQDPIEFIQTLNEKFVKKHIDDSKKLQILTAVFGRGAQAALAFGEALKTGDAAKVATDMTAAEGSLEKYHDVVMETAAGEQQLREARKADAQIDIGLKLLPGLEAWQEKQTKILEQANELAKTYPKIAGDVALIGSNLPAVGNIASGTLTTIAGAGVAVSGAKTAGSVLGKVAGAGAKLMGAGGAAAGAATTAAEAGAGAALAEGAAATAGAAGAAGGTAATVAGGAGLAAVAIPAAVAAVGAAAIYGAAKLGQKLFLDSAPAHFQDVGDEKARELKLRERERAEKRAEAKAPEPTETLHKVEVEITDRRPKVTIKEARGPAQLRVGVNAAP